MVICLPLLPRCWPFLRPALSLWRSLSHLQEVGNAACSFRLIVHFYSFSNTQPPAIMALSCLTCVPHAIAGYRVSASFMRGLLCIIRALLIILNYPYASVTKRSKAGPLPITETGPTYIHYLSMPSGTPPCVWQDIALLSLCYWSHPLLRLII